MAIVGSLQSGLSGNHEILYAKALIDGIIAVMASTMGIFWYLCTPLYESLFTLSAHGISGLLNEAGVNEMNCVSSMLIIAITLNMLNITKIKVANFLVASFLPVLLCMVLYTI